MIWNALWREIKIKVTEYKLLFNRGGHEEEFEDTKGLIRISISKNRQHNGQKEKFWLHVTEKIYVGHGIEY